MLHCAETRRIFGVIFVIAQSGAYQPGTFKTSMAHTIGHIWIEMTMFIRRGCGACAGRQANVHTGRPTGMYARMQYARAHAHRMHT